MQRFPWPPRLAACRDRETSGDRHRHRACAGGRGRGGHGRDERDKEWRRAAGARPNGCPTNKSLKTAPIADLAPPARTQIVAFDVLSGPINEQTQTFTLKVRVGSTCSVNIKGASVYVTAVPYNQFSIPAEELTGDDGTATLVFRRDANFPASSKQQQLTLFIRATKPGEDTLAGVSTRRLVAVNFSSEPLPSRESACAPTRLVARPVSGRRRQGPMRPPNAVEGPGGPLHALLVILEWSRSTSYFLPFFPSSQTTGPERTSFPGRFVVALSNVTSPSVWTWNCCVLLFTELAPTVTVKLPESEPNNAVREPLSGKAPPVWLLTKCQVAIPSPQDVVPIAFDRSAATTADGTARAAISAARPNTFRMCCPPSPRPVGATRGSPVSSAPPRGAERS